MRITNYFRQKLSLKLITCLVLVALADFLFYEQAPGWTLGLFSAVLILAAVVHDRRTANYKHGYLIFIAAIGLAFAMLETYNCATFLLFLVTLLTLVLAPRLAKSDDVRALFKAMCVYSFLGWLLLIRDGLVVQDVRKKTGKGKIRTIGLVMKLLLPLVLSTIFIILFAQANPLIGDFLDRINWAYITKYFSTDRILFWVFTLAGSWAVIRPKFKTKKRKIIAQQVVIKQPVTLTSMLFNESAIMISLFAFNAIFIIQNLMDVIFLWAGAKLPNKMSYAQYAHQGAYPLIATALLAALFVLIALRPGSKTESSLLIRVLVYIWVGQNIFLVISSILRLTAYIEEYSLTYLRISALIWMGLVALGLFLIVARIYLKRSNLWLINLNATALYATLYICCFINFGSIIADYNVRDAREITGHGTSLDMQYLVDNVGEDAIPALIWFQARQPESRDSYKTEFYIRALKLQLRDSSNDWRQMTLRKYRIQQY